jgi:hypothetical protein
MVSLLVNHLTSSQRHVHVFVVALQKDAVDGSTGIDALTLAAIAISAEFWSVLAVHQRGQMFEDVFRHEIWTQMISQSLQDQHWVWGKLVQINQHSHSIILVAPACKFIGVIFCFRPPSNTFVPICDVFLPSINMNT